MKANCMAEDLKERTPFGAIRLWTTIRQLRQMNSLIPMAKNILRTGKKVRPKTAIKGKRFRCAKCRKRSPKPVKNARPVVLPKLPQSKRRFDAMTILFLHGWQSVPGGVKPTYLKDHGHTVINPKLPDDDFEEAVRIAQAEFDKHQPQVVVGSSRGGAVAMNINSGDARFVLLCPAWKKWGTAKTVKPGTVILHSRADDVVPFADSEELVRNSGLPASALIEVGNDHRLADPEPLAAMLRECGLS